MSDNDERIPIEGIPLDAQGPIPLCEACMKALHEGVLLKMTFDEIRITQEKFKDLLKEDNREDSYKVNVESADVGLQFARRKGSNEKYHVTVHFCGTQGFLCECRRQIDGGISNAKPETLN